MLWSDGERWCAVRYLPAVPMTLRQAVADDILPGQWHIPADTILLLSTGPMMRYVNGTFV